MTAGDITLIHSPDDLRRTVRDWRRAGHRVGVVPTMGALHNGHLSLVEAAYRECDAVVVTIFVNPSQFAPNEDFSKYPRTLTEDIALLTAQRTQLTTTLPLVVFAPEVAAVYPPGFATQVTVSGITADYEGAVRTAHFAGVATVVLKLLLMSEADAAFFGEKDFQQLAVIRRMVRDLNVPTNIIGCPTMREKDGLAMSSRNRYLTAEERIKAQALSRSLAAALTIITSGETCPHTVTSTIRTILTDAGIGDSDIDYVAVVDPESLTELTVIQCPVAVLLAARIGTTRLIDNLRIDASDVQLH